VTVTALAPIGQVLSAYTSAARARPAATDDTSFASMVGNAAEAALQSVNNAEQTVTNSVTNKTDVQDVVMALGDAEVTMQTVVAVRDKILGAYNDIMHMSV
jgi:flagellar hook-basal body complex protein FliE